MPSRYSFVRLPGASLLAIGLFFGVAQAQEAGLAKFFGHYIGTGIADNSDAEYFRTSVRDFDVDIRADGMGFKITWTTISRGGTPDRPKIKRKTNTMAFVPTGRTGVYAAKSQGDPLMGEPYSWAVVSGAMLKVYSMTLNDKAEYEMQQYIRTIVPTGMTLEFKRVREGEKVRVVRGELIK